MLSDCNNPYYDYDLLGLLKSDLVQSFYIDAAENVRRFPTSLFSPKKSAAFLPMPILGILQILLPGQKGTKFEDDYLELVFDTIAELGFNGVTICVQKQP